MYGFKPQHARGKPVQNFADGENVKPRGFKEGGLILGPGTGTSDSIEAEKKPGTFIMPADSTEAIGPEALEEMGETVPVRLSNGEFEFPPEQVQALGEAVLTVLRDATHERTEEGRQASPKAAGFAPRQFFADGGTVQDDKQKRLANQTAMHVIGAQEAAANQPKPAPATAPAPAAATQSEYGRQMSALGGALVDGAAWLGKTIVSAPGYGFSRPSAAPAPAAAAITNPTDARLAAGTQRAPAGFAPAIKPQAPASASAPVVVQRMAQPPQSPAFDFDNFQPAPGQGAFRNEQTGEVTRLQDGPSPTRYTRIWKEPNVLPRSDARPASPRQSVRAPVLNPNGGVFAAMADFTNQAGQAVQAIAANKGMRNDRKDALDQQRVGLDAASTFAKIEQGDRALGIDGRRADTAQDLVALQADELGLKREAQGFQTRAAKRLEDLQSSYQSAKTPEERTAIAQQLRELQGKGESNLRDNFMAVGGGQEWDAQAGVMRNVPQRLVDLRTGREVGVPGQQQSAQALPKPASKAEFDALPKGTRFTDPNGQVRIK